MTCMGGCTEDAVGVLYQIADGSGTDGVDQVHRKLHEKHYEKQRRHLEGVDGCGCCMLQMLAV